MACFCGGDLCPDPARPVQHKNVTEVRRELAYWEGYVACHRKGVKDSYSDPEHVKVAQGKVDVLKWVLGEMEEIRG